MGNSALYRTWLFTLCVVAALLLSGAAARPAPRAMRPYQTPYHSLSQACSGVLEDVCPPASTSRADCLMEHFVNNTNHECKMWVGWRTLCLVFVEVKLVPRGLCGFTKEEATPDLLRECLGTVDKGELPAVCFENPYYKSLSLHGRRQMDDDADL